MNPATDWHETTLRIAGRDIKLKLPREPEQILNTVATLNDQDRAMTDPYWGFLWSSCPTMAELILTSDWSPNLRVLEIGCGSGLVGVAALLKGLNVTFADIVPEAANLAVENARLNGFPNTTAILFDWRQPPQLSFDLIMANEVLYSPALHEPLLTTLNAMLATDGQCWIGDPGRATAKDFIHLAHDRGFSISFRNATGRPGIMPSAGIFQVLVLSRPTKDGLETRGNC